MTTAPSDDGAWPRKPLPQDVDPNHTKAADQGLDMARHVFVQGCGLLGPAALWRHQPHWCVLDHGFGLGLKFLATWQAWRADAQRPARLHCIATMDRPVPAQDLLRTSQAWPECSDLMAQLVQQWWGLLPGMHRLSFESGAVVLDLVVGDSRLALPQLDVQAHSVYLDGCSPATHPQAWQKEVLQPLQRLSRPQALWAMGCVDSAVTHTLAALGFAIQTRPGLASHSPCLVATSPGGRTDVSGLSAQEPVLVLGAGLAGAHVARALANLGQRVRIVDAQGPAAGASGLPAGILAIHTSGDDQDLTRLTRMGLRHSRSLLAELREGEDWAATGLDEFLKGVRARRKIPQDAALRKGWSTDDADASHWRADWWQELPGGWHQPKAGWIKPSAWIAHLLDHPLIETAWGWQVNNLLAQANGWRLTDARQRQMGGVSHVVVALGPDSMPLLHSCGVPITMQPVRGQVSWGKVPEPRPVHWPAIPRNGDGSLLPQVPLLGAHHWVVGSSFDRHSDQPIVTQEDQRQNALRWYSLAPETSGSMPDVHLHQSWAGVRATVRDRLPLVGAASAQTPGLWLMTGLGARGLTVASIAAEQLAAWMTHTSSPLPIRLGRKIQHPRD
jgi:tRNA 5-methylaminomethyl-2-thiouridine biosynthesis bifunctional protein